MSIRYSISWDAINQARSIYSLDRMTEYQLMNLIDIHANRLGFFSAVVTLAARLTLGEKYLCRKRRVVI